jgi:(1->4)-alpha-D-glucan 1-alpha-D-glucosylmutase
VDAVFDDPQVQALLTGLVERVAAPGWSNALATKLVAITAPGVCDVYQGSELWEQSLVDPDNRRPVDFDRRRELLARAGETSALRPTSPDDEGLAKLWVTTTALRLRRDRPDLFDTYEPLVATGPAADHVLAFDRGGAVTVVTRLPVGLAATGGWGDTTLALPEGRWRDVLDGSDFALDTGSPTPDGIVEVRLADLMADLPVALLVKED